MTPYVLRYSDWLNESFDGDDILLYMSSKSSDWDKYFYNRELKYANNAGNMYGLGVYTNLEKPGSNDSVYKKESRDKIYGDNLYEFSINSGKLFYLYYDYFKESVLYDKLGKPSESEFVKAQFNHFGIQVPRDINEYTPAEFDKEDDAYMSQGQCAFNFYKYMNSIYFQRKDGTLKTPVAGFVYKGRIDGRVAVIWSPYLLTLLRKKVSGSWSECKGKVVAPKSNEDPEEYIFDGNQTKEKEEVYRDLVAYKGVKSPLGQFVNIVIRDNKTIDATFKGNVPESDGFRHAFLIADNKYIKSITDKGYKLDEIDCWVKFGKSPQSRPEKLYLPSGAPKQMVPNIISGGVILSNVRNAIKKEVDTLATLGLKFNKKLVLDSCYIDTDSLGYDIEEMNYCVVKDSLYKRMKKYKGRHGRFCCIKESDYEDLKSVVSENSSLKKEEKEELASKYGLNMDDFEKIYSSDDIRECRKK